MSYDLPDIAAHLARLAAAAESNAAAVRDIESRLRRLERFYWAVLGGSSVISAAIAAVATLWFGK